MSDTGLLFPTGVSGATGGAARPAVSAAELVARVRQLAPPGHLPELRLSVEQRRRDKLGVVTGIDPTTVQSAGWGVIFARDADPAVREALTPLLRHRQQQAGARYREYTGESGYQPGESKARFLARHGAAPGAADPDVVPYYLLLVGSPEAIPFSFQYQLDVQYAVGRLFFDTLPAYERYARNVLAVEETGTPRDRRVQLFGVRNPDDEATRLCDELLVTPLRRSLTRALSQPARNPHALTARADAGPDATQARLLTHLGTAGGPALLFSASHGVEYPCGDARQLAQQGALVCAEWPGPGYRADGGLPPGFFVSGEHVPTDADARGLISFHFGCFGAGTPRLDEFSRQAFAPQEAIAPHAFLGGLPMRLLSLPRGALAAIAHVDRAWSHSFAWQETGTPVSAETAALNGDFHSALERIAQGLPVGFAMEYFGQRYAELATMLSDELDTIELGGRCDPMALAALWTAHSDARGYVVLGDPAARLVFRDATDGQPVPATPAPMPQVTPPSPAPDALAALLADLWQTLERASREPGHPFRVATLGLSGAGFPELHPARLCGVGTADDGRRVLRLQAPLPPDARRGDPRCTLLFLDATQGIEVRVRGHAVFDPTGLALTVCSLEHGPLDKFDSLDTVDTVDTLDTPNASCPVHAGFTWPDDGSPVRSERLTAP